ncbi:MAG: hypothetical protein AAFX86_06140 [Pseudomonadota bacterium]
MLKPILLVCAIYFCPLTASAEAELSTEWSRTAANLSEDVTSALEGEPMDISVEHEIARFASTAERLSRDMSSIEGAEDLVCIFRGIAEDADLQLRMLHMPGKRQASLRRLATLLHDAERIGLAAAHLEARGHTRSEISTPMSCEADPEKAYQYLTEQP